MHKLAITLTAAIFTIFFASTFAASIKLHENNSTHSKVTTTVKRGDVLIPIYQKGDWIKVGDPRDGKVGWVKQSELYPKASPLKLYQSTITEANKDGKKGYRVIEYTGTKKLDNKQVKAMVERMRKQQQAIQKSMNAMIAQSQRNFRRFSQEFQFGNWPRLQTITVPVLQPIIIMPEKQAKSTTINKTSDKK